MKKTKLIIIGLILVTLAACKTDSGETGAISTLRQLNETFNRYTHHQIGFFMDTPRTIYVASNCEKERVVATKIIEDVDQVHIVPEFVTAPGSCRPINTTIDNVMALDPSIPQLSIKFYETNQKNGLEKMIISRFGEGCTVGALRAAENSIDGNEHFVGVIQKEGVASKCEFKGQIPGVKYNAQLERAASWLTPEIPIGFGENGSGPFVNDLMITITFIP